MKRYVLRPDSFLARLLKILPNRRISLLSIGLLLLLLLLSQLIYAGISYLFPRVRVVDWGTIEYGQWVDVLVLRNELVLTAPFDGEARLLVEEGARVRAGEAVAELINVKVWLDLEEEQRLALRTIALRLNQIDQEVAQIDKDLAVLTAHDSSLAGIKTEARYLVTQKAEFLEQRASLLRNVEMVLADWQSYYQLIVTDQPGIFSTKLDGGEGLDLLEHTEWKTPFKHGFSGNRGFASKLTAGQPWAKLIMDYTQTLVCQLPPGSDLKPPEEAVLLVNGRRFNLSFLATDYTNRQWYFTENSLAPELLEKRSFPAYLIYRSATGLRVPTPALAFEKNTGWTVSTSVKGEKRPVAVEVVDMNDQWAIINGIPLGTVIYDR
ncbi:MAG TPA: hypothetical protein GXZ98_08585 [Firmicutes bacterium]|nr:hypothetical protein [Bacillota bacterium]